MEKKREGYKKTELGWIPENWEIHSGEKITKKITKGSSPKWQGFEYAQNGILFITSENVRDGFLDLSIKKFLPVEFNNKQKNSQLKQNDVLINIVGASIGRSCIYESKFPFANINQAICLFRLKDDINSRFILFFLQCSYSVKRLLDSQAGSARQNLSLQDLRSFLFLIPPLPEQQKIADILSTVDDKISSIESQIQQTEHLKKGLMNKLLTEGIGHTEFKDTEIGRIPKGWAVVSIGDIGKVKGGKRLPKGTTFSTVNTGLPYIKAGNLKKGTVLTNDIDYLTPEVQQKIKQYTIHSCDVYMTIVGAYIGDVGVIPDMLDGANLTENACKICMLNKIHNLYLAFFLRTALGKKQINDFIGEGAQPKLALYRIEKILLPLPPIPEQKQIASILSSVDDKLDILNSKKEAYTSLKKGLMAKLLTGQIRVKTEAVC